MLKNSGAFHSLEGLFAVMINRLESWAEAPREWQEWCKKKKWFLPIMGFPFGLAPGIEIRLSLGLVAGDGSQFEANLQKADCFQVTPGVGFIPGKPTLRE